MKRKTLHEYLILQCVILFFILSKPINAHLIKMTKQNAWYACTFDVILCDVILFSQTSYNCLKTKIV